MLKRSTRLKRKEKLDSGIMENAMDWKETLCHQSTLSNLVTIYISTLIKEGERKDFEF